MTERPAPSIAAAASTDLIGAADIAHACGCQIEWVVELTEIGIVRQVARTEPPERWRFDSEDLHNALQARRLQRDFEVNLEAAALMIDLSHEVRRLRALLGQ